MRDLLLIPGVALCFVIAAMTSASAQQIDRTQLPDLQYKYPGKVHVVDVTPTILAVPKLPEPKTVDGIRQKPMEGVSMVYSFANAKAPTTHTTQYFEMFGNRGIYNNGWTAVTRHSIPCDISETPPKFSEDKWELYNTNDDFSQSQDLAAKYPDKLKALQRLFLAQAEKYNVLPLDDRRVERFVPTLARRP
jgi:arylsulfatase A-like enzyme